MTVLMTVVGTLVFIFSLFTVGFKSGYKRLVMFAVTGLILDCLIATIAAVVMFVAL